MLHHYKNSCDQISKKEKEDVEQYYYNQPEHLQDGDYIRLLTARKAIVRRKIEKWKDKENNSIGVYQYNIHLDQYEKVTPSDKWIKELHLLIKLDELTLQAMKDGAYLSYTLIDYLMKKHFTQEEYDCDAFVQYRKDLGGIERHRTACCCIL